MGVSLPSQLNDLNKYIAKIEVDSARAGADTKALNKDIRELNDRISVIAKSVTNGNLQFFHGAIKNCESRLQRVNSSVESAYWNKMGSGKKLLATVAKFFYGLAGKEYRASEAVNISPIVQLATQAKQSAAQYQQANISRSLMTQPAPSNVEVPIFEAEEVRVDGGQDEEAEAIAASIAASAQAQAPADTSKMRAELAQSLEHFTSRPIVKTDKELNEMNANLGSSPMKGKTWVAAHEASPAANGTPRIEIERFSQKGIVDSAASGAKLGGSVMGLAGKDAGMVKKGLAGLGGFVVGLAAAGAGAVHDAARLAGVASNWNRAKEYVSVENSNGQARIIVRDESNKIKGNFASVNQFKQQYLNPDKVASFKDADAAAAKAAPKPQPAPAAAKPAAAQAAPAAAKESAQLEKLNAFIKAHPEAVLRADHPAIKYIHDVVDSQEQGKAPLPAELRNRYALVQEAGEWKIFGVDRDGERWYGDALDPESGNEFDLQAILKEERTDIPDGQLKASVLNNEWIETVQVLVQSAPAQAKPQPAPSREAQQALAAEAAAKAAPKAQPPLASPARPSALKMAAEAAALQKEAARPVSPTVSRAAQEQLAQAAAAEAAARAAALSPNQMLKRAIEAFNPKAIMDESNPALQYVLKNDKASPEMDRLYAFAPDKNGVWFLYKTSAEGENACMAMRFTDGKIEVDVADEWIEHDSIAEVLDKVCDIQDKNSVLRMAPASAPKAAPIAIKAPGNMPLYNLQDVNQREGRRIAQVLYHTNTHPAKSKEEALQLLAYVFNSTDAAAISTKLKEFQAAGRSLPQMGLKDKFPGTATLGVPQSQGRAFSKEAIMACLLQLKTAAGIA